MGLPRRSSSDRHAPWWGLPGHDPELAVYLCLAAVTGARPGETCGLRWTDIDARQREMRIERRIVEVHPQPFVQDLTKTGKTRRVPLDEATLRAAGSPLTAAVCEVVDLVDKPAGTIVHLRVLPGTIEQYPPAAVAPRCVAG